MDRINLGKRLKYLRLQKGLGVRQLARLAGCSPGFISQLEMNLSSPTIANFEKICDALKMSLVDVLREDAHLEQPIYIPRQNVDRPLAMCWKSAKMRHVLPDRKEKPFTALQLTLEVGGYTPVRSARRSINQLAIVLLGDVELRTLGKHFPLSSSDTIYFDLGHEHEWHNLGETPAEVLMVHPYVFHLIEQEEEDLIYAQKKRGR